MSDPISSDQLSGKDWVIASPEWHKALVKACIKDREAYLRDVATTKTPLAQWLEDRRA